MAKKGFTKKVDESHKAAFVGRESYLTMFSRNLGQDPGDEAYKNIISIYGQGGVGKTWLLGKYKQIADDLGAVSALIDHHADDVINTMNAIAQQFEVQGYPIKSFSRQYDTYREKSQKILADRNAPSGLASLLGRFVGTVGVPTIVTALGGPAAGAGAAGVMSLVSALPQDKLAALGGDLGALAGQYSGYLITKFGKSSDFDLLSDPVRVLTPLFLEDLMQIPDEVRPVFFFDTYERSAVFLDKWLRDLLAGRYGEIPADIVLAIAGRYELGRDLRLSPHIRNENPWSYYNAYLARVPLAPFTEEEAIEYLRRKKITDGPTIRVILSLSDGLPQNLELMAESSPDDPSAVGDPAGSAVERFLQWIDDPKKKRIALYGALPRAVNPELLSLIAAVEEVTDTFEWLKSRSFVDERPSEGWVYSRAVRRAMLRQLQNLEPKGWATAQSKLADYFAERREQAGLTTKQGRRDKDWQKLNLENMYHRLCASPHKNLPVALSESLTTLKSPHNYARHWADTVHLAGQDCSHEPTADWGAKLDKIVQASDGPGYQHAASILTELMQVTELDTETKVLAFSHRANYYFLNKEYELAQKDQSEVLRLAPENAEYWTDRSITHFEMGRFDEAIYDSHEALHLDPVSQRARGILGVSYFMDGRYEEASAEISQLLERDPDNFQLHNLQGQLNLRLKQYEEALHHFDRAEELGFEQIAYLTRSRIITYTMMGSYPEALAAVELALQEEPDDIWALVLKLNVFEKMGSVEGKAAAYSALLPRLGSFLNELRKVMAEAPPEFLRKELGLYFSNTGLSKEDSRLLMDQLQVYLDADPATAKTLLEAEALANQANTFMEKQEYEPALKAIDDALALREYPRYWLLRGLICIRQGLLEDAVTDLDRAINLDEQFILALMIRGDLFQMLGRQDPALADYSKVLSYQPENGKVLFARGNLYFQLERWDDALVDLTKIIELEIEPLAMSLAIKARITALRGEFSFALDAVNRALALEPENWTILGIRNEIYLRKGDFERHAEGIDEIDKRVSTFVHQYYERLEKGEQELARTGVAQKVLKLGLSSTQAAQIYQDLMNTFQADETTAIRLLQADISAALADQHLELSLPEHALKALDKAVELVPDEIGYRKRRGQLLEDLERYEEALLDYDKVVDLDPDDKWAIAHGGEAHRNLGRYEQALADFHRAIDLDPDYLWAIEKRGQTYLALERYGDALPDFGRIIADYPENLWVLFLRGIAYQNLGRYEEALADYDRAIKVDPGNQVVRANRGETLRYLGRLDDALVDLERVSELDPTADWSIYLKGLIHLSQGHPEEARQEFNGAIQAALRNHEQNPEVEAYVVNLGLYHLAIHEEELASQYYRQVLEDDFSPGMIREALDDIDDYLKVVPDHPATQALRLRLQEYLAENDERL